MPRVNIYDLLYVFVVDGNNADDVIPYMDENEITYSQTYHGSFFIYFNKEKDYEKAMLFKLKFGDIARISNMTLMMDIGDDDDVDFKD